MTIDKLIELLKNHGIDVHSNKKEVKYILTHGSDERGRYYTHEQILVNDSE